MKEILELAKELGKAIADCEEINTYKEMEKIYFDYSLRFITLVHHMGDFRVIQLCREDLRGRRLHQYLS